MGDVANSSPMLLVPSSFVSACVSTCDSSTWACTCRDDGGGSCAATQEVPHSAAHRPITQHAIDLIEDFTWNTPCEDQDSEIQFPIHWIDVTCSDSFPYDRDPSPEVMPSIPGIPHENPVWLPSTSHVHAFTTTHCRRRSARYFRADQIYVFQRSAVKHCTTSRLIHPCRARPPSTGAMITASSGTPSGAAPIENTICSAVRSS